MFDYLEFSVGKLREVAMSFGIIFFKSKSFSVVCRRTSYCISGGIFAQMPWHDPLGALDCNSNRVLPSFDHFSMVLYSLTKLHHDKFYWTDEEFKSKDRSLASSSIAAVKFSNLPP